MSQYPRPPPPPPKNQSRVAPPPFGQRPPPHTPSAQTPSGVSPGGGFASPPPPPFSAPPPASRPFAPAPPPLRHGQPTAPTQSFASPPPPPPPGVGQRPLPPPQHSFQLSTQPPPSSGPPSFPTQPPSPFSSAPGFGGPPHPNMMNHHQQQQPSPNQQHMMSPPPGVAGYAPPPPPHGGASYPPVHPPPQHQHQHMPSYPGNRMGQPPPPSPYGGQYPGAPQQGQPPMPSRGAVMDPSKIPRISLYTRPNENASNTAVPVFYPRAALERSAAVVDDLTNTLPPPADSRYTVQDDGNASPEMIRSTLYQLPEHRGIWHQTGDLPMGVVCQPLAVPSADFVPRPRAMPYLDLEDWQHPQPVPLIDAQTARGCPPPPRCGNCHAYTNPFFDESGQCNMCTTKNRAWPADVGRLAYQYGTVEWAVDGPYIGRSTPVEMVHLYAIDLTCPRLNDYVSVLTALADQVATHASRQSPEWKPRLGVCFVCSAGIFIRKRNTPRHDPNNGHAEQYHQYAEAPHYVVMSDVTEDPFCPLPMEEWTWDVSSPQGVAQWETFWQTQLEQELPQLYQLAKARNVFGHDGLMLSCGGAALQFLAHALQATGGRGTWITWRRANYGAGKIPHRDEKTSGMRFSGTYSCATPLQIQKGLKGEDHQAADFYNRLAQECVEHRVCLDVVYHTNPDGLTPFLDLATMGELCRHTGGKLAWIRAADWQETLQEELSQASQSFVGYDAVFKVRTSTGLQLKAYFGNPGALLEDGGLVAAEEINLSCVTPSTCIATQLEHSIGGIKKGQRAFIQAALLYSTPSGQRRVRVSTLALASTTNISQIFRSVDMHTTATLLTRECIERLRSTKGDEGDVEKIRPKVRAGLYHMCVLMLAHYRKYTNAISSPMSQLLLPDKMKLLPLFCMGMMKSPLLRPSMARRIGGMQQVSITPTSDERSYAVACSHNSGLATALLLAHPVLFDLQCDSIEWIPSASGSEASGVVGLPKPLDVSVESMEDSGVYLLDSYDSLYLVFGKDVGAETKTAFLDPSSEAGQRVQLAAWQARAFSSCLQGCESSSSTRPNFPPVVPVFRSEGRQTFMETHTLDLMVDDAIGGEKDYKDFLVNMHRRISERVEATK